MHYVTIIPSHHESARGSSHHVTKVQLVEDLGVLLKHAGLITQEKDTELGGDFGLTQCDSH